MRLTQGIGYPTTRVNACLKAFKCDEKREGDGVMRPWYNPTTPKSVLLTNVASLADVQL